MPLVKELNKYEFPNVILKDLGMIKSLTKSGKKQRKRTIIIDCPDCDTPLTTRADRAKGKLLRCGSCANSINSTKHGCSSDRLYRIWRAMKGRCYNENNEKYLYYGGKGISVDALWKNSYEEFKAWSIHNGYKDALCKFKDSMSIDRIDSSLHYTPDNCQWISVGANSSKQHKDKKVAKEKGLL